MTLNDVSAKLSTTGSPSILLVHDKTSEILQTLRLVPSGTEHKAFIISTWLHSYRHPSNAAKRVFMKHEPAIAESRWKDCLVATDEDGYTVYGWLCRDEDCLQYAYVIPELRKLRVLTRMLEHVFGGQPKEYARRWPYTAHAPVNDYRKCVKHVQSPPDGALHGAVSGHGASSGPAPSSAAYRSSEAGQQAAVLWRPYGQPERDASWPDDETDL